MNVTGKQGQQYDEEELYAMARDAKERKAPDWVVGGLITQITGVLTRSCADSEAHAPHVHIIHHKALHLEQEAFCLGN